MQCCSESTRSTDLPANPLSVIISRPGRSATTSSVPSSIAVSADDERGAEQLAAMLNDAADWLGGQCSTDRATTAKGCTGVMDSESAQVDAETPISFLNTLDQRAFTRRGHRFEPHGRGRLPGRARTLARRAEAAQVSSYIPLRHHGSVSDDRTETLVVLLHGWPVTSAHWRYLIPALRAAGMTAVPVTLPGLGTTPEGDATDYRKINLAERVRAQLVEQGVRRYAIIGHDWGGSVGFFLSAIDRVAVSAIVVEEEILPGIDVAIPAPGRDHYPSWHTPFNRAPGLAEALVPGREAAYYGAFLQQSAGPAGLEPEAEQAYLGAYGAAGILEAGLAYYRTRDADLSDVLSFVEHRVSTPVLAIGGRYAMGAAVAQGMRALATDVTGLVLERSGHYPAEQEPKDVSDAVVDFLRQHA